MGIILASKSPRRQELLKLMGINDFKIIPSDAEENIGAGLSPADTVKEIALMKARDVRNKCGNDDVIIAADTLVYLENVPLGKPKDEEDAADMLQKLSGRMHSVYTGVAVIYGGKEFSAGEGTDVYFREITDAEIEKYIKSGEPMDKAGAYAIQGKASVFVEKINGDYFNVIGLPVCRLYGMLKDLDINLF